MCAFVMICTSVIVLPSLMLDGCASDQYTCSNGQCIPLVWECDGFLDCFDSSDEFSCGMCNLERLMASPHHCVHALLFH